MKPLSSMTTKDRITKEDRKAISIGLAMAIDSERALIDAHRDPHPVLSGREFIDDELVRECRERIEAWTRIRAKIRRMNAL